MSHPMGMDIQDIQNATDMEEVDAYMEYVENHLPEEDEE